MTVKHNASLIKKIEHKNKVIYFDQSNIKKITASKLAKVLGSSRYDSPFSAACELSRIYSDSGSNKYTETGNELEPVIRSYVRANIRELIGEHFDLKDGDVMGVEEPMQNNEHFPDGGVFGGKVDGYILINGERVAVLEIKTTSNESGWIDEFGTRNKVPVEYVMQASLYAKLSGLDRIVYVAGFLRDNHYADPHSWVPCNDNCAIIVTAPRDISEEMDVARRWYKDHMIGGVTPQWDENNENDLKIVEALTILLQDLPKKEMQELMDEYIKIENELLEHSGTMDIVSKLTKAKESLKEDIKPHMIEMLEDGQKKVVVGHDGHAFTLLEKKGTEINKERLKNDGLYDAYVENKVTYQLSFK